MNKLNTSILPFDNSTFSLDNFNPLRYQIELFDPFKVHMYVIGQTNYILVVQPEYNPYNNYCLFRWYNRKTNELIKEIGFYKIFTSRSNCTPNLESTSSKMEVDKSKISFPVAPP